MTSNFNIDVHAIGIFQMERKTFDWLSEKYWFKVKDIEFHELEYNLKYAIIFARLRYLVVPHPLPDADDVKGLAAYWKKYYNTEYGAGTVEEFVEGYEKYVLR